MKLKENKQGKIVYVDTFGESAIYMIHCSETIEELKEDSAIPYLVAEECTNYPYVHLVTAFSEDEALQQVDDYLREKEGVDETHLIGVFECELY